MAKIKYGVEYISNEGDKITMYQSDVIAREKAERLAEAIKPGECVSLFYAECDDAGKLATNEFNIIQVWDK